MTRDGVPVAELDPVPRRRSRFVGKAALAEVVGAEPHIDAAELRADADASIDPSGP